MAIKVELETITPVLATKFLKKNIKNRRLSKATVAFYVSQMKAGQWQPTGDTIKFDVDGNLRDGQHRMEAVVLYGKPIDMFVARGLEKSAFTVIDTGKSRSTGDVVSTLGYKNATTMAATVRMIIMFRSGRYHDERKSRLVKGVSNTDVVNFIRRHNNLDELVTEMNGLWWQFRYIPTSALTMLYFVLSERNKTKAETFFHKYATGVDLSEKSPIRHLRDRLMRDAANKTRLSYRDKLALFIYAWNAYLKNKEMEMIRLQGGHYKFPTPI